ncbi:hypothetical protein PV10_08912 [Exophiala mesophila]|uniref:DUF7704 domain-containing protein n=1 Tax=Exophiala mesophila TaxID=212818 RepID=A0A0D1Z3I6_EXOME|nr:uncharacterized protein PV10_08912 [Exophiala mesophila]KIV89337.1 hypothetical protein PV10_08912 [Exophiala mesophila]
MPPKIPFPYILFFLWIEPASTLVGAFYAWFKPSTYLELQHAASAPSILGLPLGTNVVLRQLGNLYLAFAFNEALVLRATNDLNVWRVLLLGLLIADFGHLYSCLPLGVTAYYDIYNWNGIDYGNFLFVYVGALTRICFLSGVGFSSSAKKPKSKAKKTVRIQDVSDNNDINTTEPLFTPTQLSKSPAQSTRRRKNKK